MTTHSTKYIFAFCIYPYILFILFFLRPIDNNVRCDGLISLYRTISLEPSLRLVDSHVHYYYCCKCWLRMLREDYWVSY